MMSQDGSSEYLKNAVMTATQEQLQLMLYDGAIRFARQAKDALERKDLEMSCEKLLRAQRIVVEMQNGLRPEVNPALCEQLTSLYGFIYDRLVEANMKRDAAAIEDAIRVLEHQRETWRMLIDKVRGSKSVEPEQELKQKQKQVQTARQPPKPAESGIGASLSVQV